MDKKTIIEDIILVAITIATVVIPISLITNSCGQLGPQKELRVEVEDPPPSEPVTVIIEPQEKYCDGEPASTVREISCPDNGQGKIIEVCKSDGKWYEASRDCRAVCESEVVSWDLDIKNIIIENCTGCHGAYRDYEAVKNIALTGLGGSGGESKLAFFISSKAGEKQMPKGKPPLPKESIELINQWIKDGALEKSSCEETEAFIDQYYIDKSINDFGDKIFIKEDRFNYRFFVFAHKYNQGLDLEPSYKALNRALNSISKDNDIHLCQPIEEKGVVCAMDLSLLGIDVNDRFYAINHFDEFKFISNTTIGRQNQILFDTSRVFFHHDDFISIVFTNFNFYNYLLGYDNAKQALSTFGIDFDQDILDNNYKLIGTNESDISAGKNTRLIGIFEAQNGINGKDTQVHISFDNPEDNDPKADVFQNPFLGNSDKIFKFAASEYIGQIANGMLSFWLSDNGIFDETGGVLQPFAPTDIVNCNQREICVDATINAPIDCFACHHDGYIIKEDQVFNSIKRSLQFDADDIKLAKQVYLDKNQNAATFNRHNERYLQALAKLGIKAGERNHLIQDFITFEQAKTLDQVAGFLFVRPEYLFDCIASSANLAQRVGGLLTGAKVTKDTLIAALPFLFEECEINIDPVIPVSGG